MKVQLDKTYPMPSSADVAWTFLQDLEAVAACMPGAKITERVDDAHYKGTVSLRLGPAALAFRGEIERKDVDAAARSLRLSGKGTDSTGTSGASLDLTARIDALDADHCNLVGASEVSVSGKVAGFGARMMQPVADELLKKFADNFAARVGAIQAQQATPATDASARADAPSTANAAPPAGELNGLALLWSLLKNRLRALLSKRPA